MKFISAVWILFAALSFLSDDVSGRTNTATKGDSETFKAIAGFISCECDDVEMEFRFPLGEETEQILKEIENVVSIRGCTKCAYGRIRGDAFIQSHTSGEKTSKTEISKDNPADEYSNVHKESPAAENRVRRDIEGLGGCNFPRNLKTSHLSCTEFPAKIKCTQRCIFGHTLDEGISREMKCDFSENVWKPQGFQECNPFVDCSMTLVATGNKSCQVGTPYLPTVCNVTCGDYEDKVATPLTSFECQVNGGWDKPLPHCVISGSGFALVPPPNVKSHSPHHKDEHKKMDKPLKMEKSPKMDRPAMMDKPQRRAKPKKHVKPATAAAPQH